MYSSIVTIPHNYTSVHCIVLIFGLYYYRTVHCIVYRQECSLNKVLLNRKFINDESSMIILNHLSLVRIDKFSTLSVKSNIGYITMIQKTRNAIPYLFCVTPASQWGLIKLLNFLFFQFGGIFPQCVWNLIYLVSRCSRCS